jgi:hypothetical protein
VLPKGWMPLFEVGEGGDRRHIYVNLLWRLCFFPSFNTRT